MLNSSLNIALLNAVPFSLLAIFGAWCIARIKRELKG
jgi:hypothetical protein